jgi:hypothetical protein
MGPIILVFIVALLIILLAWPAIRERIGREPPPSAPDEPQDEPYEVVVRRLDDHRKKTTPGDEGPTA